MLPLTSPLLRYDLQKIGATKLIIYVAYLELDCGRCHSTANANLPVASHYLLFVRQKIVQVMNTTQYPRMQSGGESPKHRKCDMGPYLLHPLPLLFPVHVRTRNITCDDVTTLAGIRGRLRIETRWFIREALAAMRPVLEFPRNFPVSRHYQLYRITTKPPPP